VSFQLIDTPHGIDVDLHGAWSGAAAAALRDGRADGVVANYARGFVGEDLEFLRGLPVRRVTVLARWIDDLGPVLDTALPLERLSVQSASKTAPLDVRLLKGLLEYRGDWRLVEKSIAAAGLLQTASFAKYSASDLAALEPLQALSELALNQWPSIRSLDGVERLPAITRVAVGMARSLADIRAVGMLARPQLTGFDLQSCSRIDDLEPIAAQVALVDLDFANSGDVASLAPLAGLRALRTVGMWESTRVVDGDLSPLLDLPELADFRMMNRRHYRPSVREVQERIAQRLDAAPAT
jgi:hypothetical protein